MEREGGGAAVAQRGFVGDTLATLVMVALTALCIGALVASAGTPGSEGGPAALSVPAPPRSDLPPLAQTRFESIVVIIAVSEERTAELRTLLDAEASLRALLGEQPRAAWIVSAATEAEAASMANVVSRENDIPGALQVTAVVVKAVPANSP